MFLNVSILEFEECGTEGQGGGLIHGISTFSLKERVTFLFLISML